MIKKTFKLIGLVLLGSVILSLVIYFSFIGWEYISGRKYIDYLNQNKETVKLSDSFSFKIMNDDIKKSKLILVGEVHGFEEPTKFDVDLFKYLYHEHGIRTYIAELDFAQASLMNIFLETGNDSLLHAILKNWVVIQGRKNKDYYDKYRAFHEFYQQLPENDKFRFIGVDKIQDWKIMMSFVNKSGEIDSTVAPIIYDKTTIVEQLKKRVNHLLTLDYLDSNMRFELNHLFTNFDYHEKKARREKVLFDNFYEVYKHYDLSHEKIYGYFGFYHAFLYRINGKHPMASQIRESDLGLENKILSMNFTLVDCEMIIDSKMLPEFMRTGIEFSKMPVSYDNILIMYTYGIQDFKRVTEENHKSIFKLNGKDSPYKNSNRLITTIKILPFVEDMELTDKGKPYIQYTVFVRNSDWAEPIKN